MDHLEKVKQEIFSFLPTSFDSQSTNDRLKKVINDELTIDELNKILSYLQQLRATGFIHAIIEIKRENGVINIETRHSIAFV